MQHPPNPPNPPLIPENQPEVLPAGFADILTFNQDQGTENLWQNWDFEDFSWLGGTGEMDGTGEIGESGQVEQVEQVGQDGGGYQIGEEQHDGGGYQIGQQQQVEEKQKIGYQAGQEQQVGPQRAVEQQIGSEQPMDFSSIGEFGGTESSGENVLSDRQKEISWDGKVEEFGGDGRLARQAGKDRQQEISWKPSFEQNEEAPEEKFKRQMVWVQGQGHGQGSQYQSTFTHGEFGGLAQHAGQDSTLIPPQLGGLGVQGGPGAQAVQQSSPLKRTFPHGGEFGDRSQVQDPSGPRAKIRKTVRFADDINLDENGRVEWLDEVEDVPAQHHSYVTERMGETFNFIHQNPTLGDGSAPQMDNSGASGELEWLDHVDGVPEYHRPQFDGDMPGNGVLAKQDTTSLDDELAGIVSFTQNHCSSSDTKIEESASLMAHLPHKSVLNRNNDEVRDSVKQKATFEGEGFEEIMNFLGRHDSIPVKIQKHDEKADFMGQRCSSLNDRIEGPGDFVKQDPSIQASNVANGSKPTEQDPFTSIASAEGGFAVLAHQPSIPAAPFVSFPQFPGPVYQPNDPYSSDLLNNFYSNTSANNYSATQGFTAPQTQPHPSTTLNSDHNPLTFPPSPPSSTSPKTSNSPNPNPIPTPPKHKRLTLKCVISTYRSALLCGDILRYLPRPIRALIFTHLLFFQPSLRYIEVPDKRDLRYPYHVEYNDLWYTETCLVMIKMATFSLGSEASMWNLMVFLDEFDIKRKDGGGEVVQVREGYENLRTLEFTELALFEKMTERKQTPNELRENLPGKMDDCGFRFSASSSKLLRHCPNITSITIVFDFDKDLIWLPDAQIQYKPARFLDVDAMVAKYDFAFLTTLSNLKTVKISLKHNFMALQKWLMDLEALRMEAEWKWKVTVLGLGGFWGLKSWFEIKAWEQGRMVEVLCPRMEDFAVRREEVKPMVLVEREDSAVVREDSVIGGQDDGIKAIEDWNSQFDQGNVIDFGLGNGIDNFGFGGEHLRSIR